MFRSLTSQISFFVLIALIMGGFPNYTIQEAYAAAGPLMQASTSTVTTTTIDVDFDVPVFNKGGSSGTDYISCFIVTS
ncbi:MAG: hypothetical protein QQN42_04145, partial [Nitrosopumilus sp.]